MLMSFGRLLGNRQYPRLPRNMKHFSMARFGSKFAFLLAALLPSAVVAQDFTATLGGDVDAGFRKTGTFQEKSELVVYLGNINTFLSIAAGASTNISFYTNELTTNMCPDGLGNLQWSVSATFQGKSLTTSVGSWPKDTCWYTLARTNVAVQTSPIARISPSVAGNLEGHVIGISTGGNALSGTLVSQQGNTNAANNMSLIVEPTADASGGDNLSDYIGDQSITSFGDFGGGAIDYSVENTTPNSFTSATVSDLYANVPTGSTDPISSTTSGNGDYLGYFTLNPNGTLTFTRAAAVTAPTVSSVSATVTNGFGPLTVVFSDSTSGSGTNWVWNFGNGTIITNTTAGNVTNIYTMAGSYTVTLTVYGPGGSGSYTVANFIVTSPTPKINFADVSGKLVFTGMNCPSGVQYRILTATNIATALPLWKPIYTNTFGSNGSFAYTNTPGSTNSFFVLVSP